MTIPTNPSHYKLIVAILSGISNVIFTKMFNFDIIEFFPNRFVPDNELATYVHSKVISHHIT